MFDSFDKEEILDEAYEVYFKILTQAVQDGTVEDPLKLVGFFLGLNIAENILYQKLIDCGCTIETIEKSKEKISRISRDIIAQVRGKVVIATDGEKV